MGRASWILLPIAILAGFLLLVWLTPRLPSSTETVFLTYWLVVVTTVYVFLTGGISRASEKAAEASMRMAEIAASDLKSRQRPFVGFANSVKPEFYRLARRDQLEGSGSSVTRDQLLEAIANSPGVIPEYRFGFQNFGPLPAKVGPLLMKYRFGDCEWQTATGRVRDRLPSVLFPNASSIIPLRIEGSVDAGRVFEKPGSLRVQIQFRYDTFEVSTGYRYETFHELQYDFVASAATEGIWNHTDGRAS